MKYKYGKLILDLYRFFLRTIWCLYASTLDISFHVNLSFLLRHYTTNVQPFYEQLSTHDIITE